MREGSLEAPTRHPVDWRNPEYYEQAPLERELRGSSTSATAAGAA